MARDWDAIGQRTVAYAKFRFGELGLDYDDLERNALYDWIERQLDWDRAFIGWYENHPEEVVEAWIRIYVSPRPPRTLTACGVPW